MADHVPADLLLAPRLEFEQVAEILSPFGFKDVRKADANFQAIADDPHTRQLFSEILEEALSQFAESADPDQALNNFERFTRAVINKAHLLSFLKQSPQTLELVARVFGNSHFLSEILIRDPFYLYWIADPQVLNQPRTRRQISADVASFIKPLKTYEKKLAGLRVFKRKEVLHIGVRDLLRLASVRETLDSISTLAEVVIHTAYKIAELDIRREFGTPYYLDSRGKRTRARFAVIGLGKLGGGELNFSSDVDLMYVYDSDAGETLGGVRSPITNAEYFKRLSQQIGSVMTDVTNEGYVYRVDLRLRPDGKAGPIANSIASLRRYYAARADTWERLVLLKAWPVGGDCSLGLRFINLVRSFIYGRPLDLAGLDQLRRIKQGIDRDVLVRGERHRNVKLGFGGIREIEFIVQSLQVAHGERMPSIRRRSTIEALQALFDQSLLHENEFRALSTAYIFLRDVENKLQMVFDLQTHVIPGDPVEIRACSLRLGYKDNDRVAAGDQFLEDYRSHTMRVHQIYEAILQSPEMSRFEKPASSAD